MQAPLSTRACKTVFRNEVPEAAGDGPPKDVVKWIATEGGYIDERGAVGIRLKPAAETVRIFRRLRRKPARRPQKPSRLL